MYLFKFDKIAGINENPHIDIMPFLYKNAFFSFYIHEVKIELFYYNGFKSRPSVANFLEINDLIEICNSGKLVIDYNQIDEGEYKHYLTKYKVGILLDNELALYFKIKHEHCTNFILEEV